MKSVLSRLGLLEARKVDHILIEVEVDGQTRRLTAQQFADAGLIWPTGKIISGGDLNDLDLLLATVKSVID